MSKIPFHKFLRTFLINRSTLYILAGVVIIQLIIFFTEFNIPPLYFYPSPAKPLVKFYNDSIDNGNSVVVSSLNTDSLLQMDFILRKGFVRPYTGISLAMPDNEIFNISRYNQLNLDLETKNVSNLVIYLNTYNDTLKNSHIKHKLLFFCHNIEMTGYRSLFKLKINDFKVPDWWYDVNNMSPSQEIKHDWGKIISISIATGLTPDTDIKRQISVHSVTFVQNNRQVIYLMILVFLLVFCILFIIRYLRYSNQEVIIKYKPIEIKDNPNTPSSFLDYINRNFHNPELSLDIISKNTGVSQRKISESIASQYNCNVKTYINRIRINESIRLLKETQLNISEIAYKVGFSSPNNFNRVFKYITEKTPSDFQQHKTR